MQAPGAGKIETARLWVYTRNERPRDGAVPPVAWYRISTDRKAEQTKGRLTVSKGRMHADGYAGFEELYRSGRLTEVACMAHIRRKFVHVHKSRGSAIAEEAIRRIADLYADEKDERGRVPDERMRIRKAKPRPVFDELILWHYAQSKA